MSKASFNEVAQRPNERREVDLFRLNGFESYYKFTREKRIDICCLGSGVKYQTRAVMQDSHSPIGQLS